MIAMYWNALLSLVAFGLTFFFMICNGSRDEGHAGTQKLRKDPPTR